MDSLKTLFERRFHSPADRIEPLRGQLGGSDRKIVRLAHGRFSAIGVLYAVREENVAFLEFSKHFRAHGLSVPEIYAADLDNNAYLEEDLGDTTLYQFLSRNRNGESVGSEVVDIYREIVQVLPRFQVEAGSDLNYEFCYPRSRFDRQSIAWDLNYFKYYFLKPTGIHFSEQALEDDFSRLNDFLLNAESDYFLYRDFQSRNIMLRDGTPFFIDYQGGRKGALQYDIASLLYDAKADLPPGLRLELLECYLDALSGFVQLDRDAFMRHFYAYVYVRILQALGTYGFRGFFERKRHFLESVPYAMKNLGWLLRNVELPIEIPTLIDSFRSMLASEKLRRPSSTSKGLTVRVSSFSFHESPPVDETGNGGGFVFDARSLPNPGREERYAHLTGKDAPVVDYLVRQENVQEYLASVISLVDASVDNYQRRGFGDLMVSFGCTGGQHRSVYLADQLARHLEGKTGVEVEITHLGLAKLGQ